MRSYFLLIIFYDGKGDSDIDEYYLGNKLLKNKSLNLFWYLIKNN